MGSTARKTRNYKEKSSMLALGHIALPLAAVIAVGLLFVGIKLFFLSPQDGDAIEFRPQEQASELADDRTYAQTPSPEAPAPLDTVPQQIETKDPERIEVVLASPVSQTKDAGSDRPSAARPQQQQQKPAGSAAQGRTQQAAATKKPAPAAAGGSFGVQIGAFTRREGAESVAENAAKLGYKAFISSVQSGGKTFHRVRISAGNSRADAEHMSAELEKKGFPVSIVANP